MKNFLTELKLSIFDLMAYIFPSIILILSLTIIFVPNWDQLVQDYWPYILVISYIIGNILHQLSFWVKGFLWEFYHNIKERDKDSHSLKTPKTFKGKFAIFLRYFLLDRRDFGTLSAISDKRLQDKYKLKDIANFDLFIFKETITSSLNRVPASYDYLHYQTVLSFSFSVVCLILFITVILKAIFSNMGMYITSTYFFDFPYISIVTSLLLLIISSIFFRRGVFFEKYRKSVINSTVIKNI